MKTHKLKWKQRLCPRNELSNSEGTCDVGADVVLVAVRAEVNLDRWLVDLRCRAEETHGWKKPCAGERVACQERVLCCL